MTSVNPGPSATARALGWGLASGLLLSLMFVGAVFAGYRVGRAGMSLLAAAVGMLIGFAITMNWMISSSVSAGCPSCVDFWIAAPGTFGITLIPLAAGFWFGRRSLRRRAAATVAA